LIIGVDLQTLETPEAERGIGRYALGLAEHLARFCPRHKVVGFGFAERPSSLLARCGELENFEYRPFGLPHDRLDYLAEGVVAPLCWSPAMRDLDLYLVTSPMMLDIVLPDSGPFPIAALFHDLIPLRFRKSRPDQMSEHQWNLYDARLEIAKDYDFFLTNSETTRRDLNLRLGIAPEKIRAVGVGIGERFAERLAPAEVQRARSRYGIRPPYILSVTGHSFSKNWRAVFESFAALPRSDRRALQLVVVCRLDARSRYEFQELARNLGIAHRTILTGGVDDQTLLALHQGASALLFPSLAEGFGIPIIEAMAADVPVVASDIEVFREVAGEAALFADPERPDLFAEALGRVLHDKNLSRDLIEKGRRRVDFYRWPKVIERAEPFLSEALRRPLGPFSVAKSPAREGAERVAYFTLLPPQVSGIADYNQSLVKELARHVNLELLLDDIVPADREIRETIPWHSSRDFPRLHRERPFDLVVYHIGNNVLHWRQYRMAIAFPGVVMLHDYCLRFFAPLAGRRFSGVEIRDHIERYYERGFPRNMPFDQVFSRLDLIEHPLNEELIRRSLGIVVHSNWSRDRIRQRFPEKAVEVVPFGIDRDPRPRKMSRDEIRARYAIGRDAFVVTCAGNLTPAKRLISVLYAFAELVEKVPRALLCFVGQATDPAYLLKLNRLVRELRISENVRFMGYVEMEELYDILDMSDVCLNLRYPTLGETSGVLLRMMQLGKPIIVSAVAQFLEFPDSVCWKADVDGTELAELVRYLRVLERSPEVRETLGRNARRFVESWTWDKVALLHIEAWRRIASQPPHHAFSISD